jgi:hypothetical protein
MACDATFFCGSYLKKVRMFYPRTQRRGRRSCPHRHRIRTELRGSRDFSDLAAYQAFLQEFIARKNAPGRAVLTVEIAARCPSIGPRTSRPPPSR